MRVVVDTNVLVSGLLKPQGPPGRVVALWKQGRFTPILRPELVREYRLVLLRPKFCFLGSPEERLGVLDKLLGLSNPVWVETPTPFPFAQDPKDGPVPGCALTGRAQALLALGEVRGIPILSARAFLTLLEPGPKPPL